MIQVFYDEYTNDFWKPQKERAFHTMFARKRIGGPTQTAWVFNHLMRFRDSLRKDPVAVGATFEAEMFYYDPVYRTVPTYITLDLDGEDGLRYTEVTQEAYTAG